MTQTFHLHGMTWSDPRSHDPVAAAAEAFGAQHPGAYISWGNARFRALKARRSMSWRPATDLMSIDHPHMGAMVGETCLLPLDTHADEAVLARLGAETVGKSFQSYF